MDSRELAQYLDSVRITGQVATSRQDNLKHIELFLDGNEHLEFGVTLTRDWTFDQVFDLMYERVGIDGNRVHLEGQDTIDVDKCVAALDRFADRLGASAHCGERILFATGHPAGMLPVHAAFARSAAAVGATVVRVPEGRRFGAGDIRQIFGVLVWHQHGGLMHTHFPEPMRLSLDTLAAEGLELPQLVVADHGWAGHAASSGLPTIGFADCNDPGLFVSEAQGQVQVAVPLDDNMCPGLYDPLIAYVLDRARLPPA